MKQKLYLLLAFTAAFYCCSAQSLKSPAQFLGYELGQAFTPHYKIVQYFEQAAAAMPQMMKLEKYGETNEGRPLMLAVIASAENFSRLEQIRTNNLRMTGLLPGKADLADAPAIVWLSYNVHGNEASSSEVSMKTLYELLHNDNGNTNEWLRHVVVLIDPCLNPDGRDRYVNWYKQMVGNVPNVLPEAREHKEPWPGGRSNHYNFDLNRDWAWQTQVESRQRMVKYNEWMPQVHVDFHEQYPTSPYYFAPAAEPMHEAITPFQRSFQTTIGKNHAKYFDAKGWLYFTKEYFDLFYPSYGDTYPIFNGAIGMTYEQAGHGMAGLALALGNDDTLKLSDRVAHHFTTSISTIEVAATNYKTLTNAFSKYFEDGNNGLVGDYKTYIIAAADAGKMAPLIQLFNNNKIQYRYAAGTGSTKAYNFFTGKDEVYNLKKNDLIISSTQPKAALIKVLFEPVSKLSDTATYDITAWALPYVYGLQGYASKDKIAGTMSPTIVTPALEMKTSNYGYLVNYHSFQDGKLLATLLKWGMKLRFAEKDFVYNGERFAKGTLVVLKHSNENKMDNFLKEAKSLGNKVTPVTSGFMESGFDFGSDKLHMVKMPQVALVTGSQSSENAAGEIWHLFDQELHYPITLINADDIGNANLKDYDVLIFPNGNFKILKDKDAVADLKKWVRQGGRLIALENAAFALSSMDEMLEVKKEDDKKDDEDKSNPYVKLKKYENRERDDIVNNVPGAIYKVELDNSHPLAFGYPSNYYTLKLNSKIFEFASDSWNVGVIKKEKNIAGFVGSSAVQKVVDGTVIAVSPLGAGNIIYFADDPVYRSFWENGKLLLVNAVFLVGE